MMRAIAPRRRFSGRDRSMGQALVEFAVIAPIFFLILFAIIDFGRYVYYVQVLNNAAREGTRYAIVHGANAAPLKCPTGPMPTGVTNPCPDDAAGNAVKQVVRNFAVGVIGDDTILVITPSWPDGDNAREHTVSVNVTYQFHSVIPLVPLPTLQVNGASTLVINN
jgi:Flp pilus assembly protein TadG